MEQKKRTTTEALGAIEEILSSIDHSERALLSAPERIALMGRGRKVQDRVTTFTCVLTDEAAQSAVPATGTPLTSLIGIDEGRDPGDAARQVFDARDVSAHTTLRDLALAGKLSPRHAVAIAQGLATLPDELTDEQKTLAEQAFIRRAPKNTPKQLSKLAPQVLAEVAPELTPDTGDDDAILEAQKRRARTNRSFNWGDDGDGSTWFRGSLPYLEAAPLIAALQAYVESDRHAERNRFTSTRATNPHPRIINAQVRDDNHRSPVQRRADALTQLIADHREAPNSIGDRPRIVVTIREQDLRDRAEQAGVLPKGEKITAGDLRRLCCDADLMPAVLGGHSEILDVGRTNRLVTPAIRRALTLRDKGCIFPHCTATDTRCEAHHLKPWSTGGDTALNNMVLLCPHHHKLVEPNKHPSDDDTPHDQDRWHIHIDHGTGKPVITAPGRTTRFTQRPATSAPPMERIRNDLLHEMVRPDPPPGLFSSV